MADISEKDEHLLKLLREKELLTTPQEQRVRGAMARGMELVDALSKTPLVDPVKFATLKALSSQEFSQKDNKPQEPTSPRSSEPNDTPDIEDASVIELDENDLEGAFEFDGKSYKIENHGPINSEVRVDEDVDDGVPIHSLDFDEQDSDASEEEVASIAELPTVDADELKDLAQEDGHSSDDTPAPEEDFIDLDDLDDELIMPGEESEEDLHQLEQVAAPNISEDKTLGSQELLEMDDDFDLDFDMDLDLEFPDDVETGKEDHFVMETSDSEAATDSPWLKQPAPEKDTPPSPPKKNKVNDTEVGGVLDDIFGEDGSDDPSMSNSSGPRLPAMGDIESYKPRTGRIQTFELTNDEGIPLIGEVNEFLRSLLDEGISGVDFFVRKDESKQRFYGADKVLNEEQEVAPEKSQRLTNRIKVMSRIEPWRKNEAQRGMCTLLHNNRKFKLFVYLKSEGEKQESMTIYLQND